MVAPVASMLAVSIQQLAVQKQLSGGSYSS
jgi:hypothetical protein